MSNKPFKHLFFSFILIFFFVGVQSQETERVRVYRVQFAASKTFIQPSYFQKKFNLEDSIQYFEKDDYYKYYVGDFDTRAEAVDYFNKTGDVGYVISMMVDRPIVVEQDTIQQQVEPDTVKVETEDTVKLDTTSVPTENQEIEEGEDQDKKKGFSKFQYFLIGIGVLLLALLIWWLISRSTKRKNKEIVSEEAAFKDDADEEEVVRSDGLDDDLLPWDDKEEVLEDPFGVLDDPEKDLSGWDQLRMFEIIKKGKAEPPIFSYWLDSDNSTIVAFCLRMIRSLKQEDAYKAVARLLNHKKDDIRAEAIVTLGALGNKDALSLFRKKFDHETLTNRMLILRSMGRMPDDSNIEFLKDLIRVSGNLQIEAANALAAVESVGTEGVESILEELGISSEIIARHILINKL